MERTSWNTRLRTRIEIGTGAGAIGDLVGTSIHLIGSARSEEHPADLDLVLVYNAELVSIAQALALRGGLVCFVEREFGLPVDVCLLSTREVEQSSFLLDEYAELVR